MKFKGLLEFKEIIIYARFVKALGLFFPADLSHMLMKKTKKMREQNRISEDFSRLQSEEW